MRRLLYDVYTLAGDAGGERARAEADVLPRRLANQPVIVSGARSRVSVSPLAVLGITFKVHW
jgi:hypothetical protein